MVYRAVAAEDDSEAIGIAIPARVGMSMAGGARVVLPDSAGRTWAGESEVKSACVRRDELPGQALTEEGTAVLVPTCPRLGGRAEGVDCMPDCIVDCWREGGRWSEAWVTDPLPEDD